MCENIGKVLVTGGCGYIGSAVCAGLWEKGYSVVAIDDKPDPKMEGKDDYKWVNIPPTDKTEFARFFRDEGFTDIVHLACTVDNDIDAGQPIGQNEQQLSRLWDSFLYRLAAEFKVQHFVMASTCQIYPTPKSREPVREDDAPSDSKKAAKSIPIYGRIKLEAEETAMIYFSKAKDTACAFMRVSPVYSTDFTDNLRSKIIDPKDKTAFIYRTGDYGFSFLNLYNFVDFIVCYLKIAKGINYSDAYNVADKGLVQASDIIKFIRKYGVLGAVIQRDEHGDVFKSKLKFWQKDPEFDTNYRHLNMNTLLGNYSFEIFKANKICPLIHNISNSR